MIGTLAPLGRVALEAEQTVLGEAGEEVVRRERAVEHPLVDLRVDLVIDEVADGCSKGFVLVGQPHGQTTSKGPASTAMREISFRLYGS